MIINHKKRAEKAVLNTEISLNGNKNKMNYHRFKVKYGINITENSINIYSVNMFTKKWKKGTLISWNIQI